uniref:Uncharacterized protein n=1 Tax=Neogobius melanostomus TaxID=47308 RepID=A0A8C6SWU3_9GOBI
MDQTSPGSDPDSKDWGLGLKRKKLELPVSTTRRKSRSKPSSVPSCESLRSKALSIEFKRNSDPPGLSCQSMQSNESKEWGVYFKRKKLEKLGFIIRKKSRLRPSCESLKSKALSIEFKRDLDTPGSGLSCQSMQSDKSKEWGIGFCDATFEDTEEESCPELSDPHLRDIFMGLEKDILTFVQEQLRRLYKVLASDYPEYLGHEEEDPSTEAFLNITVDFLKRRKQEPLAERLHSLSPRVCRDELKRFLQQRFSCVSEGIAKAGNPTLLNQIYTELHITEGGAAEVNQEHEVRHIEAASRKPAAPETTMKCEDLFKGHKQAEETTEAQGPIRTVLTKGVAGVGKTVLTQKFSLDWAEGRANQDIQLLFPFTFRQLNVLRDRQFSLVGLLQHFFSETKSLCGLNHQVLFILDGLDECRLPLDFSRTRVLTDPTESVSLEGLLVNLIRGNLLPSARLWITTRPAASNQIPAECVSMVTEVRGFTDSQKEEYFMKRFRDEQQATAMISHIKKSRSLFIMCHLPVFSWMLTTVLHHVMETEVKEQLPQTMTEMYIHFLVVQAKVKSVKYDGRSVTDPHWSPETRRMVESLAKLAFEQLQKGNLIFYESDMSECGLDAADASVFSGVFTQVFREEPGLYQDKVFCFIHLSVHEFLAALHFHLTFFNSGVNLMSEYEHRYKKKSKKESRVMFYQCAVDMALNSPNGHLDLFLRFLMGLSLSTNQRLLSGLQTQTGSSSLTNVETAKHIKEILNKDNYSSAEQSMNLLHCLNELNDHSLVEQVQQSMREGRLADKYLSSSEWSAVAFLVLSSDSDLEEFDLRKYHPSGGALKALLPLTKASTRVIVSGCDLSEYSFYALTSVFSSSTVTHLDVSYNFLWDNGVMHLFKKLKSAPCRLQTLSLSHCKLSDCCCDDLASVLSSSSLTHLDLSDNDLGDSGVEKLCAGLKSAPCRLEVLRLSGCLVSERGGASLASALRSAHSRLRELDLSYNHPGASTELLTAVRDDPLCPLDSLRLDPAGERWMVKGPRKYLCEVFLDPNTANNTLELSEDKRSVTNVEELQLFPHHQDRFSSCSQVLSSTALSGRCYWEVKLRGDVDIAVSYKGIRRNGDSEECRFGDNDQSWSLRVREDSVYLCHDKRKMDLGRKYPQIE